MPLSDYAKVRQRLTRGSVALRAICWHRGNQTLFRTRDRFQKKHIPFCHTEVPLALRSRRPNRCAPQDKKYS